VTQPRTSAQLLSTKGRPPLGKRDFTDASLRSICHGREKGATARPPRRSQKPTATNWFAERPGAASSDKTRSQASELRAVHTEGTPRWDGRAVAPVNRSFRTGQIGRLAAVRQDRENPYGEYARKDAVGQTPFGPSQVGVTWFWVLGGKPAPKSRD